LVLVVLGVVAGCALEHVRKDIPPPGGCDACHRHKISSGWEIGITPVRLGRAGGIPEGVDIVLGDLRQFPYHREVPAKRLAVYAAAASPEVIGNEESGIQCFVCHRSPDPPHEEVRGRFPHPWGKKTKSND
jgi:hypothetical protein